MKIGEVIREKQPEAYKQLNKKHSKKKERKAREHLSFYDIEKLMKDGCHAYRRGKGGAFRQVR